MEGVGSEAASLAGHLGLDNLCWVYDNNHITIEGNTKIAFTEDVAARFLGYGWNVQRVSDANDIDRIEHALRAFRQTKGRPTLIILDSHIGYGSPHRQDTAAAHGEPLGPEEVRLTKKAYGWPEDATFLVPDGVREHFAAGIGARGAEAHRKWTELFAAYRAKYPELATEIDQMQRRELPAGLGSHPADVSRRFQGHGGTRRLRQGPQRAGADHPVVPRRLRGPGAVEQDHADVRGCGRLPGRQPGRQDAALRHPRARDGGDRERPVAVEAAAIRRDLLHLQRLRAAGDPPVGADGAAHHLRLHARRDGRRRGRPDAPARRAARLAAGDSRPDVAAARGCQRGGRGLPRHSAAASSAGGAGAVAPAAADSGPQQVRPGLRRRARRLRARRHIRARSRR